jgi:hypothetical protein
LVRILARRLEPYREPILVEQKTDVLQSARILALVNFALADGYLAGFGAKYHFRFWRPYTAVRKADSDGNDSTKADPTWLPLTAPAFFTPPVPIQRPTVCGLKGAACAGQASWPAIVYLHCSQFNVIQHDVNQEQMPMVR